MDGRCVGRADARLNHEEVRNATKNYRECGRQVDGASTAQGAVTLLKRACNC